MPPVELTKMNAFMMFLASDSYEDIANAIGRPVSTVRRWGSIDNWLEKREAFYGKIQTKIDERLENAAEEISQVSIEFAKNIVSNIQERFNNEIQNIPIGTFKDMMSGIKDAVAAISELLHLAPPEAKVEETPVTSLSLEEKRRMLETIQTLTIKIDQSQLPATD